MTDDYTREQLVALLEAHRDEYIDASMEFLPMTSAEAEQALRDFETGVLDAASA